MTLPEKMYGHRARIGYTSPPLTTEIFPYEFYKIVPEGVTLVVTSLAIVVRSKDEVDQSYDISMRAAREMAAAGCDIVVLGGVPINLSRGRQERRADAARSRGRAGRQGLVQHGRADARRQGARLQEGGGGAALLRSPTPPHRELRGDFGCELLGATGWGSPFNQIGRIPQHAAVEMGRKLMREHPDADTILLPSPHWPCAGAIDIPRARVRRQRRWRAPGDRVGRAAPLRRQRQDRGIRAAVPGVLSAGSVARTRDRHGVRSRRTTG